MLFVVLLDELDGFAAREDNAEYQGIGQCCSHALCDLFLLGSGKSTVAEARGGTKQRICGLEVRELAKSQ